MEFLPLVFVHMLSLHVPGNFDHVPDLVFVIFFVKTRDLRESLSVNFRD